MILNGDYDPLKCGLIGSRSMTSTIYTSIPFIIGNNGAY